MWGLVTNMGSLMAGPILGCIFFAFSLLDLNNVTHKSSFNKNIRETHEDISPRKFVSKP